MTTILLTPHCPLALAGELTICSVTDFKALLQAKLCDHGDTGEITLDLAGITECDGAGIQLLLAFSRTAAVLGVRVVLSQVPATLAAVLAEYGLGERFASRPSGAAT